MNSLITGNNHLKRSLLNCLMLFFFFNSLLSCNSGGSGAGAKEDGPINDNVNKSSDPLNPLSEYLWFLKNIGKDTFEGKNSKLGEDVNLGDVHKNFTGKGIYVVVSDGRIDVDHEDILEDVNSLYHRNYSAGPILSSWHGVNPTSNDNTDAHGTFIAGIIGALKDNGKGGFGISPDSNIVGFNFLDSDKSISKFIDQADSGLDDVLNIFNYSYGASTCSVVPENALFIEKILEGVSFQRSGKGSIYVTSSGNDYVGNAGDCSGVTSYNEIYYLGNSNFDQKKSFPYLITVSALNSSGKAASYSTPGSNIWISAPGGDPLSNGMVSTDLEGCSNGYANTLSENLFDKNGNGLNSGCNYAMGRLFSGTSFAAPLVSGSVAILLEANPNLSWRDVKHILASTASQVDSSIGNKTHPNGHDLLNHTYDLGWITNGAGFKFHNRYGFGRLNVTNAVEAAKIYNTFLPQQKTLILSSDSSYIYDSGLISKSIPDNTSIGVEDIFEVLHNYKVEAVQILVSINHPWPYQLGIELVSPAGTKSILKNINTNSVDVGGYSDLRLLSNAFYGESSKGEWKIKLIDGQSGSVGVLTNWKLNIWGHIDPNQSDTTDPDPVSNILHSSTFNSISSTPLVSFTPSSSEDILRYEVSVGTSPGNSDVKEWHSIGKRTSFSVNGLTLEAGRNYFINIRSVDENENVSPAEASNGWVAENKISVTVSYVYATPNLDTNGGTGYAAYCNANDTKRVTCTQTKMVDFAKKSTLDTAFKNCSRSYNSASGSMSIVCPETLNCSYEYYNGTTYTCISHCSRINTYVGGGTSTNGTCSFNPP